MKRRIGDVILVVCLLLGLTYAAQQNGIEERSGISVAAAEAYASGAGEAGAAQMGVVAGQNDATGATGAAGTGVAVQSAGTDVAGVTGVEAQTGAVAGENGTQGSTAGTTGATGSGADALGATGATGTGTAGTTGTGTAQTGAAAGENGAQGSTTGATGAAGTGVAVQSVGADVTGTTGANAPAQSNGATGTTGTGTAQTGAVAGENGTQGSTTGTTGTAEAPAQSNGATGTTGTSTPTQTADARTEGGVAEALSAGKNVFGKETPGSDGMASGNGLDSTVFGNGAVIVSGGDAVAADVSSGDAAEEDEYANLAIADVNKYVNVRKEPNTDSEIVGKIYSGAVAQILAVAGDNDDWFQIVSGSVEGYIKSEYFIYGDAALDVIDQYVTRYAKVQVARLNVRKEPTTDSKRIGYVDEGEKILLLEDCGDWLKVQYTDSKEGYVSAEYAEVVEEFVYAKSIEEERAELAAKQALAARETVSEQKAPESTTIVFPETSYTSNEELRRAIVDYALQYEGYRYVHGGRSLASGTDCSGFTCYIYADFGYSISRTPDGQYSKAGRAISYEEIQPGDIICYSSNGGKSCTHVALYIGDGKIIHAANSRKGVIIGRADYDTIIGIRNVID